MITSKNSEKKKISLSNNWQISYMFQGRQFVVEIPTKVSDVNKAAEMLGKYYALFTEKLNVDGDMDYSIKIDYGGEDE